MLKILFRLLYFKICSNLLHENYDYPALCNTNSLKKTDFAIFYIDNYYYVEKMFQ